jgi:hypothetical protein
MTITAINSGYSPETDRNEAATDLRTSYLMCRRSVLGHPWEPIVDNQKRPADFGTRFTLLCPRCGTKRHDVRDWNGALITRQYEYPDDYKLSGQVTSEELWAEVLVRREDGRLVVKAKRVRGTKVLVPTG